MPSRTRPGLRPTTVGARRAMTQLAAMVALDLQLRPPPALRRRRGGAGGEMTEWAGLVALTLHPPPPPPPIGFQIPLAGRLHHARRQRRWRGVAVPAAGAALDVEIVAQRLLVET